MMQLMKLHGFPPIPTNSKTALDNAKQYSYQRCTKIKQTTIENEMNLISYRTAAVTFMLTNNQDLTLISQSE